LGGRDHITALWSSQGLRRWCATSSRRKPEEAFADFVCGNALSLWTSTNPDFFEGTGMSEAVRATVEA